MIDTVLAITWIVVLPLLLCVFRRRHAARASTALSATQAPSTPPETTAEATNTTPTAAEEGRGLDADHVATGHVELAQWIASTPELRALYATLGYAPDLEQRATQGVEELTGLIEATVPDFAGFCSQVRSVQAQLNDHAPGHNTPEPLWQEGRRKARTDPLWQAVLAAGDDHARVLALLNRDPVHAQLPFIEQVPCLSNGQAVWRTPVDVPWLRKRPRDVARFVVVLDRLEALFASPRVALHAQARQEVLHEIARVRRELQRPSGYLPTSLQALAKKATYCLQQAPFAAAPSQREALDRVVTVCVAVRQTYGREVTQGRPLSPEDRERFREMAQQQAQYYLHTAWMHTPWLTTHLLTNLLDADLAALPAAAWRGSPPPASPLALIRAEVASGHYDGGETLRRLRQLEERGVYVHSLVYPLLRLHRAPAAPRLPQGVAL